MRNLRTEKLSYAAIKIFSSIERAVWSIVWLSHLHEFVPWRLRFPIDFSIPGTLIRNADSTAGGPVDIP